METEHVHSKTMAGRAIDIVAEDPILVGLTERLDTVGKQFDEKMKFVTKQAEAVAKAASEAHRAVWVEIEQHLIAKGKLPKDYDPKTCIGYNSKLGVISYGSNEEHDSKKALMGLLKSLLH